VASLGAWLSEMHKETKGYFTSVMEMLHQLVRGRNLKNTPAVRAMLPYDLVEAAIVSPELNRDHLPVVTEFVNLAIQLYIDAEPHEQMARVRTVRIWDNVRKAADTKLVTARLIADESTDWTKFDGLKHYIAAVLPRLRDQKATDVHQNKLMLALVHAAHELVRLGFYSTDELTELVPALLCVIDGFGDEIGLFKNEKPGDRYKVRVDAQCNSLVIMEGKLWACRILTLVCVMRVDIRISTLLRDYKRRWEAGFYLNEREIKPLTHSATIALKKQEAERRNAEEAGGPTGRRGSFVQELLISAGESVDEFHNIVQTPGSGKKTPKGGFGGGYQKLEEIPVETIFADLSKAPPCKTVNGLFDILSLEGGGDDNDKNLLTMLFDLTFYEHPALVEAALGLIALNFQQKQRIHDMGRISQLLVQPAVVAHFKIFDSALKKLEKLAARRKLYEAEMYTATRLMGVLTHFCHAAANGHHAVEVESFDVGSSDHTLGM
jgi:hypothetical protein